MASDADRQGPPGLLLAVRSAWQRDKIFLLLLAVFSLSCLVALPRATANAKLLAAFGNDDPPLTMAMEAMTVRPYGNPANFFTVDRPLPDHWYDLRYPLYTYYGGAYLGLGCLLFAPLKLLGLSTFPAAPICLRIVSYVAALLALIWLYRFGKRYSGRTAALVGVAVLLTDFHFQALAKAIHPDTLQLALSYLALLVAARHVQTGGKWSLLSLGLTAGLIQGTKVGGPWMIPMSLLALGWGWRLVSPSLSRLACLASLAGRLSLLGAAALLAFFVSTPYAFLDPYYRQSLETLWKLVSGAQLSNASFQTWMVGTLEHQGWVLTGAAVLAVLTLLVRVVRGAQAQALVLALALAVSNVLWYASLGGLWVVPAYFLPAFGIQGVLVGDWTARLYSAVAPRLPACRWLARLPVALVLLALLASRWFYVAWEEVQALCWRQQTVLAVNDRLVENFPGEAGVLWDDIAYVDPVRFPRQHMVGGVTKYSYLMYHDPDCLILSSTLYDSPHYRKLRQAQHLSPTDPYLFSVRLYQDLVDHRPAAGRLGATATTGIELIAVVSPNPGPPPPSGTEAELVGLDTASLARTGRIFCSRVQYLGALLRTWTSGEDLWLGPELLVYRVHRPGGVHGRPSCLSGGDRPGHEACQAFLPHLGKGWQSRQTGAAVKGQAYLGYDYGGGQKQALQKMCVTWPAPGNTPARLRVECSDDGQAWAEVARRTPTTPPNPMAGPWTDVFAIPVTDPHRYWRLVADAELPPGYAVAVTGLKLVERP